MQKTDICMCVCMQYWLALLYVQVGVNPSCTHIHALFWTGDLSAFGLGQSSEHILLCPLSLCICVCKKFGVHGPLRCPLGSCDCAKAEHCVQQAAALRKSLLLLLQTGSCLPETCFLEKREIDVERESETGKNSMWLMPGNMTSIFMSLQKLISVCYLWTLWHVCCRLTWSDSNTFKGDNIWTEYPLSV